MEDVYLHFLPLSRNEAKISKTAGLSYGAPKGKTATIRLCLSPAETKTRDCSMSATGELLSPHHLGEDKKREIRLLEIFGCCQVEENENGETDEEISDVQCDEQNLHLHIKAGY
ncbi:unnamed protein product [Pleuronectes platessa]|uniref:Uncharacterized protein n=1 Tax=Pleuronectes platessa TaxID=8262 RepID=A0A9N7Z3Q6_PLEPL|nr:unnamed protein product [Pleuronectes platessa]